MEKNKYRIIIFLLSVCFCLGLKNVSSSAKEYKPDEDEGKMSFKDSKEIEVGCMGLGIIPGHFGDKLCKIEYLGIETEDTDYSCDYEVRIFVKDKKGNRVAESDWYDKKDVFSLMFFVPEGESAFEYQSDSATRFPFLSFTKMRTS